MEAGRIVREITCNIKRDRIDKMTIFFEGFGLFVLVVYAIFTILIWRANKKAAEAAKGANEAAHQALVRSNRPWIGQNTAPYFADNPTVTTNSVKSAGIAIEIHNFGASPALHVNMDVIPDVMNPPSSPETFFQQSDNDIKAACRMADMITKQTEGFAYAGGKQAQIKNPAGGQTIFPNGSASYLMPINLQMGQGTTEGHGLDLFGCIAYRDQFDETVHHTTFCYMTTKQIKDVKANERPQPCGINQNAD